VKELLVVPQPPDRAIATRADADDVLQVFAALRRGAGGVDEAGHRLFAELCYFTTREWISHAPESGAPDFIYTLIRNFYRHYAHFVLLPLTGGGACCSPQWQWYFDRAARFGRSGGRLDGLMAIVAGAYAHTRIDLADAIFDTVADLRREDSRGPNLAVVRTALLGPASNAVFRVAARDFLDAQPSRAVVRRSGSVSRRRHAYTWLWMSPLQRWRRRAWHEAMEGLARGRPPSEWLGDRRVPVG